MRISTCAALWLALAGMELAGINDAAGARCRAPLAVWGAKAGRTTGAARAARRSAPGGRSWATGRRLQLRGGSEWDMGDSDTDDDLYNEGPELQEIEELPPAKFSKVLCILTLFCQYTRALTF